MNRTISEQSQAAASFGVSKPKFLSALGDGESSDRRLTQLAWSARQNLERIIVGAGLTAIYLWTTSQSARVAALCLDATGRFFAVEFNRAEPVTVSQGWAFSLACREWSNQREVQDREAACRWEEAILRQLQVADQAGVLERGC